jgi:hypothetical protein
MTFFVCPISTPILLFKLGTSRLLCSFAIENLLFGTSLLADFVVLCGIFVSSVILRRKIGVGLVVSENCSLRVVWCNIFELRVVLCRIFTLRVQGLNCRCD